MSQLANDDRLGDSGFRANLRGASLADLVQMECLARTEAVFRVTSRHEVGYLFFRGGQVIHAVSRDAMGQFAAVEILGWREGTFETCSVAWPDAPSIHLNWQALLLLAAQTQDESGRRKLVRLATGGATQAARPSTIPPKKPVEASVSMPAGHQAFVKLDPAGNATEARGAGVGEFAASVSYSARLGQLIGDALGLERLLALECLFTDSRHVIEVDRSGAVTGVKAELDADLSQLRERAGL